MSATYYRADPGTLNTDPPPWWLADADEEVDGLRKAVVVLAERLEMEGFVGHEDCPIPGEDGWPQRACSWCHAITLGHAIREEMHP